MRRGWPAMVAVAMVAGCDEGPRYCPPCGEIRALMAKPDRTTEEDGRLAAMKSEYQATAAKLAAFHRIDGDLPDLHPVDCDCPCHVAIR